jgi:hypothetical protein
MAAPGDSVASSPPRRTSSSSRLQVWPLTRHSTLCTCSALLQTELKDSCSPLICLPADRALGTGQRNTVTPSLELSHAARVAAGVVMLSGQFGLCS